MFVGMLAIGNGEKCPFCKTIMTKDIKIFDHIFNVFINRSAQRIFLYEAEVYLLFQFKSTINLSDC